MSEEKGKCPIESTIAIMSGKWKILIIKALAKGPVRYGELAKEIRPVSAKVLTQQLREMEEDGLITRTVFQEVPPHVEYSLSKMGASLATVLEMLRHWGLTYDVVHHVECIQCHKCQNVFFQAEE
jgi:DNA-binding HxlR family transcriptional regulator